MDFDPSDLATYTNKQASELLSNALQKLGHEQLGFDSYSQAFSEWGRTFWVKSQYGWENDRDSFDPYYEMPEQDGIKLKNCVGAPEN